MLMMFKNSRSGIDRAGKVTVVAVAVMALGATVPARAADLSVAPIYKAPPQVAAPAYNWSGFYVGVNGGGGWGTSGWDSTGSFNLSGAVVGGTAGTNWQIGHAVLGLEGDVDWSSLKGTATTLACPAGCTTNNDWLATVRGRAGYAFDRFLPYVTAGLAVGDIAATVPGFPAGSVTSAGWTIGAGIEYGLVSNVSIKAEYLYVNLSDFNCGFNCGLAANGNVTFNANVFRAGLNVHF